MKRRLLYGVVITALSVNLLIGARVYLTAAQPPEKDSAYPSLELFTYVMEKVRKDYVDGQNLKYQDLVYAASSSPGRSCAATPRSGSSPSPATTVATACCASSRPAPPATCSRP